MDSPGIKFADLKKEERYKRLERNLKLAFVKQMERMKNSDEKGYYCTSPTWPSLSSINPDGTDMSCVNGLASLQVSRVESEVLSSSNNLRKVLTVHQNGHIEQRLPMATSSVKKFPINDSEKDRAIMPPPPTALFHNVKKTSSTDAKQIAQSQQGSGKELEGKDHDSLMKQPSSASAYQDSNTSQTDSHDVIKPRAFSRWRVLLNDQGQLIIKGTLECGKIARSKPVIQRFTSAKVLSIYKHIYVLHGNIVDDRNELPDYVRGKFHNGFPDDWENVYQIWRNYIAGGCQITFRWPTPITDSDDDLHSEITDYSYFKNKQIEYKNQEQFSKAVFDNGSSSGYHSKLQIDSNKYLEKSNEENAEITKPSKNQIMNKKIDDSGHSSDVKDTSQCNNENSTENLSKDAHSSGANGSSSNLKNISFLYEIIRDDKVRIILSKLGDKNCPAQYLDKFIDLIECLKYLLLYNPSTSNSEIENREPNLSPTKNQNQGCSRCSNTASFSETQETIPESQSNNLNNKPNHMASVEMHKNTQNPEYLKQIENASVKESHVYQLVEADSANESSDNDDYMGFPHVSLSHLIKPKMTKCERYRDRKNRSNDRKNIDKNMQVKEQMLSIPNKKSEQYYDSSVSISEDDYERRIQEQKRAVFPPSPHKDQNKTPVTGSLKHNMKKSTSGNSVDNERDIDGFKVPLSITRINQKSTEKQKPIIKSCEPANFDIKLRHSQKVQVLETSDVSIVEDDVSLNKKNTTIPSENHNPISIIHKDSAEDLGKELMQHPFLTYDSEDFLNEEEINVQVQLSSNKSDKSRGKSPQFAEKSKIDCKKTPANLSGTKGETEEKSSGKKKTPLSIKSTKSDLFGSKENPKVLASWIPCVVYDDEFKKKCSLTFEGKLLNEAGHILHRKFVTSPVRQRHSATLVETVHGEYYKLSGELNDTKHVLPKELLKQCRTGCPSKIKEFCEEWKRLRPVAEKTASAKSCSILDASIDTFTIPTSSRGRRIVPTLEYWNGERIVTRDNDTIYTPGREWDTAALHNFKKSETSKQSTSFSEQRPPKTGTKKEVVTRTSKSSTKPTKTENTSSQKSKEKPAQKRVAQTLKYSSSSDSEQKESPIKRTLRRSKQKTKSNPLPESQPKSITPQIKVDILTESAYNTKLRKRQRLEAKGNQQSKIEHTKKSKASTRNPDSELVWTYEKEQRRRDILSDDQTSIRSDIVKRDEF